MRLPRILEAYDAVSSFIDRQGMERIGSPREVYFVEHEKVQRRPLLRHRLAGLACREAAGVTA